MRRVLVTFLAVAFIGGLAFSQVFPDVPPDHWAEEAVTEIAALGIVIGFPDETFRGNEPFTRYQAALVISRILAVVDASQAREFGGLRAALREMAADLVAQARRLDRVEDQVAGLSDEVQSNRARIDALVEALAAYELPEAGVIEALEAEAAGAAARADAAHDRAAEAVAAAGANARVIEPLLAQARAAAARAGEAAATAGAALETADAAGAAATAAADRAAAAAAAAGAGAERAEEAAATAGRAVVLADAAESRAASALLLARQALDAGEAQAEDVAVLERALALLGERVDRLELARSPERLQAEVDRAIDDVADIRDFVERLRRELEQLRQRIEELEDVSEVAPEAIDALGARVAELERAALQISGAVALRYDVIRFADCTGACGFDVDRVYGIGFARDITPSFLTTGVLTDPDDPRERRMEFTAEPGLTTTVTLRVVAGEAFDALGHPRGLNEFGAVVDLDLRRATNLLGSDGDVFAGYVLRVRSVTTSFEPIGAEPLTFRFGEDITVRATPYVFDIEAEPGFLARISAPGFLPFLGPSLWLAYTDPSPQAAPGTEHRSALRLNVAPRLGDAVALQAGLTLARGASAALDKDDVLDDTAETSILGVDGDVGLLGFVRLELEYATNAADDTSILYARGVIDGDGLPVLNSLVVDYRQIDPAWYGIWSDAADTEERFPYALDQAGFGVEGSLRLFVFDVGAFFDRYAVTTALQVDTVTAYGVHAELALPAGVGVEGWFESVAFDGVAVDETAGATREALGFEHKDGDYQTQFGLRLRHDGAAELALLQGLDVEFEYRRFNADFSGSEIGLLAAVDMRLAPFALRPYLGYRSFDDRRELREQFAETVAGLSAQTARFALGPLRPSLMAAANHRFTSYGPDHAAGGFTATELQWSLGVVLDEFLFGDYSTLTGRYGRYAGRNVATFASAGATDPVPGVGRAWDDPDAGTTSTSGFELSWNYFDLVLTYGAYQTTGFETTRAAQQFRIDYSVSF